MPQLKMVETPRSSRPGELTIQSFYLGDPRLFVYYSAERQRRVRAMAENWYSLAKGHGMYKRDAGSRTYTEEALQLAAEIIDAIDDPVCMSLAPTLGRRALYWFMRGTHHVSVDGFYP